MGNYWRITCKGFTKIDSHKKIRVISNGQGGQKKERSLENKQIFGKTEPLACEEDRSPKKYQKITVKGKKTSKQ